MAAFTASQASVTNGSKVVTINSGESVANIRQGDFLFLAGFLVEINRGYVGAASQQYIELVKNWANSNQSNQPALVIPTTGDFRAAVDVITKANVLVNDNIVAMNDWQTQMGTVTFKNQDGTTTEVKTLKQIEADNAAQMEAYHPYPWAMRKVEFEARRAANNEKFAASGFVHLGKHALSNSDGVVNQGLWVSQASSDYADKFFLGRLNSDRNGDSKKDTPVINIAGVITDISSLSQSHANLPNTIKFAPAEDGTRTYDSATGVSVTHATPAIAFASETDTNKVVTDRVDMWGFEAFLREINDADPFVYNKGLPQSLAASINGVPTVTDNVRPDTYFAWYEGDTTSRGKGVNWKTATEAQRTAIASDPANNIYFDDSTGKFYQWCIRGRSFAGAGNGNWANDWGTIDSSGTGNNLSFDVRSRIVPQADKNVVTTFLNSTGGTYKTLAYRQYEGATDLNDQGLFYTTSTTHECYFLVCGTVNRLNQGAYHPSFNPFGSAYLTDSAQSASGIRTWSHSDVYSVATKADCFIYKTKNNLYHGNVSGGSYSSLGPARPDGRYYDAIYASGQGGVCRDMRYSAWGLTQEDFAAAELRIESGEYRGRELPSQIRPMMTWTASDVVTNSGYWPCVKSSVVFLNKNLWESGIDTISTGNFKDKSLMYNGRYSYLSRTATGMNLSGPYTCIVINKTQSKYIIFGAGSSHALYFSESEQVTFYGYGDYETMITDNAATSFNDWINNHVASGDELVMYAQLPVDTSVASEYTHTEVIGNPVNIFQCDDLRDGWVGNWNPTIPNGTSKAFPFTSPVSDSEALFTGSQDQGSTWQASTLAVNKTLNQRNPIAYVSNQIFVVNYKTKARMTKDATNSVVYGGEKGVGNLLASSSHEYARDLGFSLTSNINVSNTNSDVGNLTLINNVFDNDGKLSVDYLTEHNALNLGAPTNDSPAFKALSYKSVENQQAFINYAYTQLTYDTTAGDWGDDGKIHIADNQTTMPDENGHTVLVGTARCVEPLGWIKNDK